MKTNGKYMSGTETNSNGTAMNDVYKLFYPLKENKLLEHRQVKNKKKQYFRGRRTQR